MSTSTRRAILAAALGFPAAAQKAPGKAAYTRFSDWRKATPGMDAWQAAIAAYRQKLRASGAAESEIEAQIEAIGAYGEAELYDSVFTGSPSFQVGPNAFLLDVVQRRRAGQALDAAMGQGRNAIALAKRGWQVEGFDVSARGLEEAQRLASKANVRIHTHHLSDQDFDFGESRWDLIALLYLIEKRSIHRVRRALRPGGLVVVEAGHSSVSAAPFEYRTGELEEIFEGFHIVRSEEMIARPDWGREPIRIVRFAAEKPRA